ncbi:MAG TPA: ATP-binding protein, partial [Thermoproteales archaeon]|nr:ATP-binding protein [Thermoproteales archaeon]
MQILSKSGNEILLIYHPSERLEVGESLKIFDESEDRGLIVQVIELNLVDLPGILEDIVRQEAVKGRANIREIVSSEYQRMVTDIRNMKIARAKIRFELRYGEILPWSGWTPSRSSKIEPIKVEELIETLGIPGKRNIVAGKNIFDGSEFKVNAYDLQGINVIVGKKGTGKSHLAKTLLLGLIDYGAKVVVFDINDEYSSLRYTLNGKPSDYHDKIKTLEPNPPHDSEYLPLKFTLSYIGLEVFYSIMVDVLKLPDASAATLREIWNTLKGSGNLSLGEFYKMIQQRNYSPRVTEAIYRRLKSIEETNIITDDTSEETRIEDLLEELEGGGALIINLKAKSIVTQSIVVQTITTKLRELLESGKSEPLFIFAEEAHLYLQRTVWLDLVTRMRHLG